MKKVTPRIREHLEQLAATNGGVLNPRLVVEDARNADSPTHHWFPWDKEANAESWLLFLAGVLIRQIKVTVVRSEAAPRAVEVAVSIGQAASRAVSTRRFVSLPSMREANGGYVAVESALSDAERREEMLGMALRELRSVRKRFELLDELADVWAALDRIVGTV